MPISYYKTTTPRTPIGQVIHFLARQEAKGYLKAVTFCGSISWPTFDSSARCSGLWVVAACASSNQWAAAIQSPGAHGSWRGVTHTTTAGDYVMRARVYQWIELECSNENKAHMASSAGHVNEAETCAGARITGVSVHLTLLTWPTSPILFWYRLPRTKHPIIWKLLYSPKAFGHIWPHWTHVF